MEPEKIFLITKLNEFQEAIKEGDIDKIEQIIHWFYQDLVRHKQLLSDLYTSGTKYTTQTDLILTACRNNRTEILYYLMKKTDILAHLTDARFNVLEVNKEKTEIFKYALSLKDFSTVEMIYDYWCGNLNMIGHDIDKLEMHGNMLKNANFFSVKDQQRLVNYTSLIKSNDFLIELYNNVPKLNSDHTISPEDAGKILLNVLHIYDKYCDLEMIIIPHESNEDNMRLKAHFEDKSSMYFKGLAHIMYEVYFRKLDYTVALLILENWNLLREHLIKRFKKTEEYFCNNADLRISYEHAASSFEYIECALYHFIYRINEDWRLYLPKNRQPIVEKNHMGIHKGRIINNLKLTYDPHKLFNGPVIYFERKHFKKCLKKLKKLIKRHVISKDPALVRPQSQVQQNSSKAEALLDDNYLKSMPYMSDHNSLRKIVDYIEAIENKKDVNVLMIERVLQVIGEMLKSRLKTQHLSKSAIALVQLSVPVETTTHLYNIREFVSHADEGQQSTRMSLYQDQNQRAQIFDDVKKDLKIIKLNINSVLDIYKGVLDQSVLDKGLLLLDKRIKFIRQKITIWTIYEIFKNKRLSLYNDFISGVWTHTGLVTAFLKELPWLLCNKWKLSSKIQITKTMINNHVVSILLTNIQNIRQTLELIAENNDHVRRLNNELSKYKIKILPEYPLKKDINIIEGKMMKHKEAKKYVGTLYKVKDYTKHWKSIENLLAFCLDDCELFASMRGLNLKKDSKPDKQTIAQTYKIVAELEAVCVMHQCNLAWLFGKRLVSWGLWIYGVYENWRGLKIIRNHSYGGIEKLHSYINAEHKQRQQLLSKKKDNVYWRNKQKELIKCLINKVKLLKKTFDYSQPPSHHLPRYKLDMEFRLTLEMLLADIANILNECNIKVMGKSTQTLTGIDLGNVIDHGNPFLEEISNIFDPNDYSTALLLKATMFAEDEESIEALYELFKDNIQYDTIINGKLQEMTKKQQDYYTQFQRSPRWTSYRRLFFTPPKFR